MFNLATNSLTYQDLNDFYREETKGFNFGTSVGGNRTDQKETNLHPQGSTTIGLTHTGQEKEQITRATIGLGNITINSEPLTPTPLPQGARDTLAGLNRNVDNSQEITKDIIIGALNASVTIDNRLFTSDGRSEIANNFVNLPSNLVRAGAGVTGSALNILESAYNGVKNLSIDDAVDSWKANQSNLVAGQSMSSNDKSREVINNLSEGKSQQDIENALNSGFAKYDENGNATNTVSLYNDENDKNKGTHQHSTGDNYINSAYTDMTNTSDVLKVASHENAHNYTKNEDLANASQKYTSFSYFMGNVANLDSVNKNGTATNTSWNNTYGNTQQMNYNTSVVRSIGAEDRSNKVFEVARDLNSDGTFIGTVFGSVGNHTFIASVPDHPKDFTPEKLVENGVNNYTAINENERIDFKYLGDGQIGIIIGGYNDENAKNNSDGQNHLITQFNNKTDLRAIRDYNSNGKSTSYGSGSSFWDFDVEVREIKPKDGMSDTQFNYNIIKNAKNYQNNTKIDPVKYNVLSCNGGYNCNSFSNSLLNYSGSGQSKSTDFKGNDAGRNNLINKNVFGK